MGVICFASLKGGVGKTSLSINISHALAQRGCRVLLIDLDPSGHSSHFFHPRKKEPFVSPIAKAILAGGPNDTEDPASCLDRMFVDPLVFSARVYFDLLPSGKELNHLIWGKAAQTFRTIFPMLLDDLMESYDHIVIDTPPDFNVLTRSSIGCSDVVVVPVDSSQMSINSLEEIVRSGSHIQGPHWCIARTMVTAHATRVQRLSQERMKQNLCVSDPRKALFEEDAEEWSDVDFSDPDQFIEMLKEREDSGQLQQNTGSNSPIYLLNSVIPRTEEQNRLTFLGRTAFDNRTNPRLVEAYVAAAKEIEDLLSLDREDEPEMDIGACLQHACSA